MKAVYTKNEEGGTMRIATARNMNLEEMGDFTAFLLTLVNAMNVEIRKSVETKAEGSITFDCTEEEAERVARKMSMELVKQP